VRLTRCAQEKSKIAVNKDLWRMVLKFSIKVGGNLSNFSPTGAWTVPRVSCG
jgi:hypothetical protein